MSAPDQDLPGYDRYLSMDEARGPLGEAFARQVLTTVGPRLSRPVDQLDVLDVGCGYAHTAIALARSCRSVVGLEPSASIARRAEQLAGESGLTNVLVRRGGVGDVTDQTAFDLVVLDNVYEHLSDQGDALRRIADALRPGGVLFLLCPNKLWPIEAHYRLPALAWLPLPWANRYLQWTGRGEDYEDASYAPTYWSLRRDLAAVPELDAAFTLPGDRTATVAGSPWHYRAGMRALGRVPSLWSVSKALLVVAVKRG